MKKTISSILVVIAFLATAILAGTQTNTQKEKIPSNISVDLRKEIEKLFSPEQSQRLGGAYNLGKMGEKAVPAIPFLLEVLQGYEGMVEVREESLKYFEKDTAFMVFGGKAAIINPVQIVASDALVKIGKPAIEPLRAALVQANPKELPFAYLVEILARMQDPVSTKILHDVLRGENPSARQRAADALGYSKDSSSVEALIGALKDTDSGVRSDAAKSLKKITGQNLGEDPVKWEEWWAKNKIK